jgi:hypothetical protein
VVDEAALRETRNATAINAAQISPAITTPPNDRRSNQLRHELDCVGVVMLTREPEIIPEDETTRATVPR